MRRLALVVLICIAAALAVAAYAQMGQRVGPPGPMPQFGPGPISIAADGGFVFVLRGPELIKIKASDLTVVATTTLPKPPEPEPPMGQ